MARTQNPESFTASEAFLKTDPHIGALVRRTGSLQFRRAHAPSAFRALAESIIYQQLSGKAAATILARFKALFPDRDFPRPADVLALPVPKLRAVGLSAQKAAYIRDLAQKFQEGAIDPKRFSRMTDREIIEHVTVVKGVGEWTAQMFLMFTLQRPDVLPTGDLGIQKAFQKVFGLRSRPSPARMEKLATGWRGHRTVACLYLWRLLDE